MCTAIPTLHASPRALRAAAAAGAAGQPPQRRPPDRPLVDGGCNGGRCCIVRPQGQKLPSPNYRCRPSHAAAPACLVLPRLSLTSSAPAIQIVCPAPSTNRYVGEEGNPKQPLCKECGRTGQWLAQPLKNTSGASKRPPAKPTAAATTKGARCAQNPVQLQWLRSSISGQQAARREAVLRSCPAVATACTANAA
ncbi:hypothetical protein ABPG77_000850 [Micractinium sp. CCAP 211/92]